MEIGFQILRHKNNLFVTSNKTAWLQFQNKNEHVSIGSFILQFGFCSVLCSLYFEFCENLTALLLEQQTLIGFVTSDIYCITDTTIFLSFIKAMLVITHALKQK